MLLLSGYPGRVSIGIAAELRAALSEEERNARKGSCCERLS
jgi:hypothetical protein